MRVVLYTGKGGVGKTTTAASTAVRAAEYGHRTLVISADAAHSLGDVFDVRLGPEPMGLAERLDAVEVDARVELGRHWGRVQEYLVALFRYQGIEEVVAEELALLPGAEELMSLLAVDEYANDGAYDLVVVDCAPTDSTLRLTTLPDATRGAVRIALKLQRAMASVMTPLADGLLAAPLPEASVFTDLERLLFRTLKRLRVLLSKPTTTVRMVVTPERMVIDEARRAWTELSLFDLATDGVVLNRVLPPAALEESFFQDWGRVQRERAAEVVECFAPVRVLEAPLAEDEIVGLERLARHGAALFGSLDPAAILSQPARVRFERAATGYRVHLPLPGASADGLDVAVVAGDLVVRAGARRRAIRLPRRVAACSLDAARLEAGELVVDFASGATAPAVG